MFLFWKKVQTKFLFLRAMVAESFQNSEKFSFSSPRCKMQGKEVVLHKINFFQLKGTINLIQKWFYDSIFSEWNVQFIPVPFIALFIVKNEINIQMYIYFLWLLEIKYQYLADTRVLLWIEHSTSWGSIKTTPTVPLRNHLSINLK